MHETQLRPRFCETDALGHINNASYFVYFEDARLQFFESIGASVEIKDFNIILASAKCDFISQAFYNQVLAVRTGVSKIGNSSCELAHEILDAETGRLIARGKAVIVFFDFDAQKSRPIPEDIRGILEKHLEKTV
ncbi:thioesterase [Weizmannia acidilactici]|uniref:Thioesterase n=1 Tax=Weizmannia acidilactici TaxID=2607726 RepID=A0A5J4JI65_9BACI|nr:thioesterase family protein [Weizmannia acidilactici]GER66875.1 thioesterase [Weizmannia acidilactici]GER70128.1 thioesterase [Weizmannia acidilactici]GER74117.1 thioesterase [Weizmannia acidilactici]